MSFLKNARRVALSWKDDEQVVRGFYKTYKNFFRKDGENWYYINMTLPLAEWIQNFWKSEKVKYKDVVLLIRCDTYKTEDVLVRLQISLITDHPCDKEFICFHANLGQIFNADLGNTSGSAQEKIEEYKSFSVSYLSNPGRQPCPPDCSSCIEEEVIKRWERYPSNIMGFLIREYKDGVDQED